MILAESGKRKRVPLKWVSFGEVREGINGYAEDWFFWVHAAFKPALDIYHVEVIDKEKTATLREKMSLELFGITHAELKRRVSESGETLGDSDEHKQVMAYSRKDLIETEGLPLLFSFRQTDSLESRCGEWYVKISQAIPATDENPGSVGFDLFERNHHFSVKSSGVWQKKEWFNTTQRDFVDLLKTGRCSVIDLTAQLPELEVANL